MRKAIAMNNFKSAGKTGKGFYAALSLSIAMVGAACWYAYSQTGRHSVQRAAENSRAQTSAATTVTTAQTTASTAWTMTTIWTETQTLPVTEEAENAAALITQPSSTTSAHTETAATTAHAEQPVFPVVGSLMNPYSAGELVKSGTTGIWQTHNGIDIAAPLGTEVVCAADGTVTAIDRDALWGVCVSVLHDDGTVTRYCGLNEGLEVQAGQIMERGEVIGTVGGTAESESLLEPHLHFEVLRNDHYADPEAFLAGVLTSSTEADPDAAAPSN